MWYECSTKETYGSGASVMQRPVTASAGKSPSWNWFEFNGSKQNNIMLECQGAPGSVFLDPRKPDVGIASNISSGEGLRERRDPQPLA